jgi:predicted nucleic acid-binding Zn ribbon protein
VKRFAALLPFTVASACAQCVMCFRTAAAQQYERARVMNAGIIIMLVPPLVILGGFVWLMYRRSKIYVDPQPGPDAVQADHREAA